MLRVILYIVSLAIIIFTLIQGGESNGLSGFTGKNDLKLFENSKEKGFKKLLTNIILVLVIIFFILVIVL